MDRKSSVIKHVQLESFRAKAQKRFVKESTIFQRMRTLNEIGLKLGCITSHEEILTVLRGEAKWLFEYEICFVGLLNQASTHYVITTLSPVPGSWDFDHEHFGISEGMPGWVMKNQASIIGETESGPAFSQNIEGKLQGIGIRSLLIVPMRTGSEVLGALAFGSSKPAVYTDEDSTVAQLFALYFATALKNASVFESVRKRNTQIELINEVSRQLTSMLNLDELLKVAATAIQNTFHYFDVTVFLLSEDKSELILEAHSGSFVDFLPHGYRQKVGQGIIGSVAVHGEKVLCNEVSKDPRYLVYEYHDTNSELALPIKAEGEVVGVLNVEDTKLHAFDETDAAVLETLSAQLGNAIKNARLYDEVRRTNMKLTELDKMKSDFLGIVSHDFRSPLSSIILAGKALLKNEAVQEMKRVKEYLQIIVDQANRLNQLAEDTLSITKMESGQLSYYFKIVNLNRLIQDAIAMVRISSRHTIAYNVEPDVSFIKGDQSKLRQVLQNLIGNAAKYSPRGGKINIVAQDYSEGQIILSVSDEGIGIPADKIDTLFRKFSRVDSGETSQIKGAGLGLWICREVVEAHGGKIWIESDLGKGSTVRFTLNKAQ